MRLWGSRWWIITFRGPKSPKNPILGAWIGISSQICKKIQITISSDLCIRLRWNLTGSCVQQQKLRAWSRMVVKQFQDGGRPPFWKRYIVISQWKNHAILIFVHSCRFWTEWTSHDQKWKSCIGQTPSLTERISCCLMSLQIRLLFVCLLSVTFMQPTHRDELFGNIFAPSNSLELDSWC